MKVLGLNFRKTSRYGTLLEDCEDGAQINGSPVLPVAAVGGGTFQPEPTPSGERTPQSVRDLAAMTPKSAAAAIRVTGDWVKKRGATGSKKGEYIATITGTRLTWYTGDVVDLQINRGQISMRLSAKEYYAELGSDGLLRWSDGDVWFRNVDDPSPSSSQFQRLVGNKV
eukprot:gnl/MRDRNA2_/MRDRNA2_99358_c0_seq1.p1 gnl/MRDRNA2_/MRDRNA2_99358_c0~~gnl/MRDRNA2_/MRDRNA2_99358_c0_seq1.p1  ORF type:complete len:169 (-),score=30.03 gnl/MRDRNA2_/MRDRNA2_99358_c0_seq1:277-783(-)